MDCNGYSCAECGLCANCHARHWVCWISRCEVGVYWYATEKKVFPHSIKCVRILFQPSCTNSHSRQAPWSPSRLGQMRQGGYTEEGWSGVKYHAQATTSCLSRSTATGSIVSNSDRTGVFCTRVVSRKNDEE